MTHVVTGVFRRGGRAVRALGPSTVAVTLALIIGAAGFADAATGGNFLLGKSNTESSTAVMTDTTGIPLSLNAPSGKSPLSVNSTTQVNRLNAQYVGGDSASQLQATGGEGITEGGVGTALTSEYAPVASTGHLAAGTYYVSATALLSTDGAAAYCEITTPTVTNYGGGGGEGSGEFSQAAETVVTTVTAGTVLSEDCYETGTAETVYNAAITAIRISSNSAGTVPTAKRGPIVPYQHKGKPVIGPLGGRPAR